MKKNQTTTEIGIKQNNTSQRIFPMTTIDFLLAKKEHIFFLAGNEKLGSKLFSLFVLILFATNNTFSQVSSRKNIHGSADELKNLWQNEPFGKYNQSKELVEKRDAFSKHFDNGSGNVTAHIASGPINYQKDGQWNTIFHTILPTANGFENVTNSHKTFYPATSTGSIKTILENGTELKDMVGMRMFYEVNGQAVQTQDIQSKQGNADFNQLTYSGVYGSGIDLRLTQNTTQRKMDYIIQNAAALGNIPASAEFLVFEETVELPQGWKAELKENVIYLIDASGKVQVFYEKPEFYEQNPQKKETENENRSSLNTTGIYSINQTGINLKILTKVPLSWLKDAERQFPVVIDPSLNCFPDYTTGWTGNVETNAACADYGNGTIYGSYQPNMFLGEGSTGIMNPWAKFNITSVTDNSTINSVVLNSYVGFDYAASASTYIRGVANDPVTASGGTRWSDIRNGSLYNTIAYNAAGNFSSTGWKQHTLGGTANADLQNKLTANWFAVGYPMYYRDFCDDYVRIDGYDYTSKPYITVDYTIPCSTPIMGTLTVNGNSTPSDVVNVCVGETITISQSGFNNYGGTTYFYSDNTTGNGGWSVVPDWEIIANGAVTPANQVGGVANVNNLASFNYKINAPGMYIIHANSYSGSCYGAGTNRYINVIAPQGDPTVFGTDQWNVYGYNGGNNTLNGFYAGYYVETGLSYNTLNRWGDVASPSSASGYQGCPVYVDNHVVVSKRRGFPCGKYQLDMPNHDDDVRLYVDGVLVWSHEPGCCDAHTNIWTGYLSTASTVEVRHLDGAGGSHQSLTLTNVTPTIASGILSVNGTAGNITICQGTAVTITQSGGTYPDATYCYWMGTNNGTNWVNAWNLWDGLHCGTNTPPATAAFNTPGSYVIHSNGYNNVCGWTYHGGGGTRIITVVPPMGALQTEAISAGTCGGSTTLNVNNITGKGEKLNYGTWAVGSGSTTVFNQNGTTAENQRVNGTDPWGNTRVIWEAVSSGSNNDDGGWNTSNFPIDNTKLYRYSVWVKRSNIGNGYAYLGAYGFDVGGANTGLINVSNGANDGNPYFWYGDQSQFLPDQWVLVVGHIYPHTYTGNTPHPQSGRYTVAGGYQGNVVDYKWRPESVSSLHRTYLYYSSDPNTRQQFAYPRVDVVDGTEPSIAQLVGGFDANGGLPPGSTWTWYQGGCGVGSPVGTGASINVAPSATTDYYVRPVGGSCASSTCKNLTVTVNQPPSVPTITAGGATTFCEGGSVALTANSSLAGNAMSFNGSQSISIGNPAELQITKNATIEMWLYPTDYSQRRNPYDKAYAGEGTITQEMDGTLNYFYGNNGDNGPGGTYLGFSSGTPMNINQWNHIAIVRDITNNQMRWYVNGILTNTGVPSFNPISGVNPVTLGYGYTGQGFIGQMDEVRVWNVARTTAEIQNNRATTITPGLPGLAGYWRFDEPSGSIAYDASGFSATGTLISSPTRVIPSTAPIIPAYTWSPATGLNATNVAAVTASPTSSVTYTVSVASPHGCGNSSNTQAITVNTNSTAPTSVTGGGAICHGNTVSLGSTGGVLGTDAVDVWYKSSCNEAYTERFNTAPAPGNCGNMTMNSVTNGIMNVSSTNNDPVINMYGLGSFNPNTYRYINVRYRVTSATAAGSMQFFWANGLYGAANGAQSRTQAISSTQNVWQVVSIDMGSTSIGPGDWYHSNVTGWRFDWATVSGVTMEVDFITLSEHPMVALGATLPLTPTQTETYYTKKIGTCNSTTCNSATITLPTVGTVLAGDGARTATCNVSGGNWIHFYDNGELIVSVNANGGNLGSVTATSYVEASDNAILTQACNTGSNPQWTTAALGRRWKITPTVNTSALIRFPFENGEFTKLVTASTTGTPSNSLDNVTTLAHLKMSHYSGGASHLNVNGNWADNCVSAGGTAGMQLVPNQTAVPVGNDVNTTNGFMSTVTNGKFVQFTTPGFSEFWLHNSGNPSALPVELTGFSAHCNIENKVDLQWTTASEQHSQKFVIERSRDLINWIVVSERQAAGNSNYSLDYEAMDENPNSGISYYRLIQVDFDGTETVYAPISVTCSGNDNMMTVFPNPTEGSFTVEITSTEDILNAEVQLVDITGKLVSFRKVNIVEGKNQLFFDESDLKIGTYFVRLSSGVEKTSFNALQFKPVKVVLN